MSLEYNFSPTILLPEKTAPTVEEEQVISNLRQYAMDKNYQALVEMIEMAVRGHHGQERKKDHMPFISHPIAVAEWLTQFDVDQGQSISEAVLCVAVGHDLLEDVKWLSVLQIGELLMKSGMDRNEVKEVIRAIRDLTQRSKAPDPENPGKWLAKAESTEDYLLRLRDEGSSMACLVKIIDRAHNLTTSAYRDDPQKGSVASQLEQKAIETKIYIMPLFDKVKEAYPNLRELLSLLQSSMENFIANPYQEMRGEHQ